MTEAVRAGTYTSLGWVWRGLGSGTAHLVPARPGRLSRTACNRYPLAGATVSETLIELPKCAKCEEADR